MNPKKKPFTFEPCEPFENVSHVEIQRYIDEAMGRFLTEPEADALTIARNLCNGLSPKPPTFKSQLNALNGPTLLLPGAFEMANKLAGDVAYVPIEFYIAVTNHLKRAGFKSVADMEAVLGKEKTLSYFTQTPGLAALALLKGCA